MARIWAPAMMACVSDLLPSPGRRMNLVGRISRETPNTLPVAIGASRTMASAAGSSLLHIRWRGHRVESVTTVNALCTFSGDSPFYL